MADYEEGAIDEGQSPESYEQQGEPSYQETPESQEQPTQEVTDPQPQPETQTPFHEHPRFKEVIEQKNQLAEQNAQIQRQLEQMQHQFQQIQQPPQPKAEDPFVKRAKEIDPEFGKWAESQTDMQSQLEQFQQWRQQVEADHIRSQAESQISSLHEKNQVPEDLRTLYRDQIFAAAVQNPKLGINDLPQVYKQVHENFSKLLESTKRTERESYVAEKKQDAKTPAAQPKGQPASPDTAKWSEDPYERRQQLINRVTKLSRAEGDI